jgi:ABC-type phosphate/phosphonate transport system ATPase subunit
MDTIRMQGVSKIYKSGQIQVEALKNISFNIKEKEFVTVCIMQGPLSSLRNISTIRDCWNQSLFKKFRKTKKSKRHLLNINLKMEEITVFMGKETE